MASQIVTGIEMLQLLTTLEVMRELQLHWIPISLHHDGCTVLVEQQSLEKAKKDLVIAVKARLKSSGMQIKGLEFNPYNPRQVDSSQEVDKILLIKDNRLI